MIYVKESDVPVTKTRKNLIRQFLKGKTIKTYSDQDCKTLQCNGKGEDTQQKAMAYRSITDLHEIVLSRFPKTTLEAIVKIIYEIIDEDKSIVLVWCKLITKVVVKFDPNPSGLWMTNWSKKNHYTEKGIDGYSLEDFEKIKDSLK